MFDIGTKGGRGVDAYKYLTAHEHYEFHDDTVREGHCMYRFEFIHKEDLHFLQLWVPTTNHTFLEWGHTISRFPGVFIRNKRLEKTPPWFQELFIQAKKTYFCRVLR